MSPSWGTILLLLLILRLTDGNLAEVADFVIVGGGTAGCRLAARLCRELPSSSFILLERGEKRNAEKEFLVRANHNAYASWEDPSLVEAAQTQPSAALVLNKTSPLLIAKTLGGSSAINGAQWTRPPSSYYKSWNVSTVNSKQAGKRLVKLASELGVSAPPSAIRQTYANQWMAAAKSAVGLNRLSNPINGKIRRGVFENRGADVQKITFVTGRNGVSKAKTVQFLKNNRRGTAKALKEVILSAGPFNTPKLLQLSGIGPSAVLRAANVRPRVDLEVGEKTYGRPVTLVLSGYNPDLLAPEGDPRVIGNPQERRKFETGKASVFGVAVAGALGYLPNLAYIEGTNYVTVGAPIQASLCLPFSVTATGSIRIRSKRAKDAPKVEPNLLGNRADLGKAVECVKTIRAINAAFPRQFGMTEFTAGLTPTEIALTSTIFSYHFVGGAALKRVLDDDFRVKTFSNLRVVDSSAIPKLPPVGPMSTVYLLADFAADEIVREHS